MTRWKFRTVFLWSLPAGSIAAQHVQPLGASATARITFVVLQALFTAFLLTGIIYGGNRLLCSCSAVGSAKTGRPARFDIPEKAPSRESLRRHT